MTRDHGEGNVWSMSNIQYFNNELSAQPNLRLGPSGDRCEVKIWVVEEKKEVWTKTLFLDKNHLSHTLTQVRRHIDSENHEMVLNKILHCAFN